MQGVGRSSMTPVRFNVGTMPTPSLFGVQVDRLCRVRTDTENDAEPFPLDEDGFLDSSVAVASTASDLVPGMFVRPAVVIGRWFGNVIEPRVIDAGVREAGISASWLGHFFRSFQTGLVRTYANGLARIRFGGGKCHVGSKFGLDHLA